MSIACSKHDGESAECSCIEGGSTWRFQNPEKLSDRYQQTFEVESVRVDEDGNAQVTVDYGPDARNRRETVAASDIREKEQSGELVRTNTGHEAWKRRQTHE